MYLRRYINIYLDKVVTKLKIQLGYQLFISVAACIPPTPGYMVHLEGHVIQICKKQDVHCIWTPIHGFCNLMAVV